MVLLQKLTEVRNYQHNITRIALVSEQQGRGTVVRSMLGALHSTEDIYNKGATDKDA
jgi:hypothetical protein